MNIWILCDIALKNNLKIIEDAAQALGSKIGGNMLESIADVGCFSLYPGKIITSSGEGGLVVTDNEHVYNTTLKMRNHWNGQRIYGNIQWT